MKTLHCLIAGLRPAFPNRGRFKGPQCRSACSGSGYRGSSFASKRIGQVFLDDKPVVRVRGNARRASAPGGRAAAK